MKTTRDIRCRHFNGVQHDVCEKGIKYTDVRDISGPGMARFPCVNTAPPERCASYEAHTQEEIDAQNREVEAFLNSLVAFEKHETDACVHCGEHVESMEQVGRCVYARPCGCRLWQGAIPDAWK